MKTSSKTSNPITPKKKVDKVCGQKRRQYKYLETYKDLLTFQDIPVSELFLERLGEDLVLWAKKAKKDWKEDDQDLKITPFFTDRHIGQSTYSNWVKKYPTFKEQIILAKQIIGDARENGALRRKFDSALVIKSAAIYDPEWVLLEEWRSRLAKLEQQQEEILWKLESYKTDDRKETTIPSLAPSETTP